MSRNGKIARLDEDIRNEINERLADGEDSTQILPWLNALPRVRKVLKSNFNDMPVTRQNLSEWRRGGYCDWQIRRDLLGHATDAMHTASEIRSDSERLLIDDVATLLTARYAALFAQWNGEPDDKIARQVELLGELCNSISRLQRNSHRAEEHQFKLAKLRENQEGEERQDRINQQMTPIRVLEEIEMRKRAYGGTPEAAMKAAEVVAIRHELPVKELVRAIRKQEQKSAPPSHPVAPGQTKTKPSAGQPDDERDDNQEAA